MTAPLSPAAQAVIDAAWKGVPSGLRDPYIVRCEQCAAALRAAADQVAPKCSLATSADYAAGANNERIVIRSQLLTIATDREGQP